MFSLLIGLSGLLTTHAALSAPFCVLQLALLKYSKSRVIQSAPLAAALVGLTCGWWIMMEASNWETLLGLFILFPSWLCLVGCAFGHLLWQWSQRYL